MIMTFPLRRITLQFRQIFFTDARTFMIAKLLDFVPTMTNWSCGEPEGDTT